MTPCLTLNASFEPLTMLSVPRATRLVLAGKAVVVEEDAARPVRSRALALPRPAVIRLVKFVRVPRRLRASVTNTLLFARDGGRCAYCGRAEGALGARECLTRDHVVPLSRGGANTWENCVTACSPCNARKGARLPGECGMALRVVPAEPQLVRLAWSVRRLTPLQTKWVGYWFGDAAVREVRGRLGGPARGA